MQSFFEVDLPTLIKQFSAWGQPIFHAQQIFQGVYQKCYQDWGQFTMLSKELRERLRETYSLSNLIEMDRAQSDNEKVHKFLFKLSDGNFIESVLMQSRERTTLCISTQAGCAMRCAFCATGKMGFKRNLTPGEMLEQVIFIERVLLKGKQKTSFNLVFMGMGEPFTNYDNLKICLHVLIDPAAMQLGSRHITVSTIGIIPRIMDFAYDFPQINLAVSLHSPDDELRTRLVPINKTYPLEKVIAACKDYVIFTNRRISFEYVILKGINDDIRQAKKLAKLLDGMLCHINLIPYNAIKGFPYSSPNSQAINDFSKVLKGFGLSTTIRQSQGREIQAGCGQLAGYTVVNQISAML